VDHFCAWVKMERSFFPVYSPWLNGTVARVNRDLLQVLRALLIDYGLDFHEWPYLLPVVQANINHSPMGSLVGHSPAELFTGLPSPSPLDVVVRPTKVGK
jgi:transposase InsO family protein